MIFAQVAVPVPARAGSVFSYSVPVDLPVTPGSLVVVPFGSRTLTGIAVRVDSVPPAMATREILGMVEDAPRVSPGRIDVASWMAGHYGASLFDSLSLFLPPGWRRAVLPADHADGSPARWKFQWPDAPLSDGVVLHVAASGSGEPSGRSVRARVRSWLREKGPAPLFVVAGEVGCAPATLRSMVAEGALWTTEGPGDRRTGAEGGGHIAPPRNGQPDSSMRSIVLNAAQRAAFNPVAEAMKSRAHRVFLLHGVTGSGKTHVYLKLIESLIPSGRGAIVLVSEIAQTPDAVERYSRCFPGRVALLHSELPQWQRWKLWKEIAEGRYDVVVGPRSALFAPLPRPGLIILDEEHEPAYKQEDAPPRYHARETAIQIARRSGAVVVLGSATPDVCSFYAAQRGQYQMISLPGRYAGPTAHGSSAGLLPMVEVVDLREELKSGHAGILSRPLQSGIEKTLTAGEQTILFLNRRGSSTAVVCRDCGEVVKCRRCDVPMVFHRSAGELICHQCNRRRPVPEKCPNCKKTRISFFGAGTERVEEEVRRLYPAARVLRWDQDVTGAKGAHGRLHRQFREHQADILVGTQMVAKALDFPLVTLVGVVLADITLHLPDFTAAERSFQLLAQVAGRAGRGEREGRVIIQTYSPDHYSIVAASRHDYCAFYEQEMEFRRFHSYPPFRRLARLLYTGTGEARARFEALEMRQSLQAKIDELGIGDVTLIGPAPAFHSRVRGRYRWQITMAGDGLAALIQSLILPLGWSLDVDPNGSL